MTMMTVQRRAIQPVTPFELTRLPQDQSRLHRPLMILVAGTLSLYVVVLNLSPSQARILATPSTVRFFFVLS